MDNNADLLVGIDMGMSCTGVAYVNKAKGSSKIQVFKEWGSTRREDKAPTLLTYPAYDPSKTAKPTSWGFGCDTDVKDDEDDRLVEWFKVDLGDGNRTAAQQDEVRRYFVDYLELLYQRLRDYFTPAVLNGKDWDSCIINFYFSVPATWSNNTAALFKQLAITSGFGSQRGFKVTASLTEPHAVAAFTLCEEGFFKDGESMLIIDAGGGTVDLCFLTIDNASRGRVSTTEVEPVKGNNFGSTYINKGLNHLAESRLVQLERRDLLNDPVDFTAWRMGPSFQSNKHAFRGTDHEDDEFFRIRIPGIRRRIDDPSIRISRGEMELQWSELRELFDVQIDGIKGMVDDLIRNHSIGPARTVKVDHVLLSGGLGSSPYVQDKIKDYLESCNNVFLSNARLHLSSEPQLSVCRGLLAHAQQNMFRQRCARESFGILSRLRYEQARKNKHLQMVLLSARRKNHIKTDQDGKQWIENHVVWFVNKGMRINDRDVIRQPYSAPINPSADAAAQTIEVQIMTSQEAGVPFFEKGGPVHHQTMLQVDLSKLKPTEKHRQWWKKREKKQALEVNFVIEAKIGIAEVSFRCLDPENDKPISKSVELQVDHEEEAPTPVQRIVPIHEPSFSS